jgi:hypothetical protein
MTQRPTFTPEQEAAGKALHATNPEGWPKPLPWEALTAERQWSYIRWAIAQAPKS